MAKPMYWQSEGLSSGLAEALHALAFEYPLAERNVPAARQRRGQATQGACWFRQGMKVSLVCAAREVQ